MRPPAKTELTRPFLKWAGNKYRLVERVKAQLPAGKRLVEPFVGSGAVFLNTDYARYRLSDSNPDLIQLYQLLQQEGERFIDACRDLFSGEHNNAEQYYALRAEFNTCTEDPWRRSVLFIYLNRHGYNGLCRYNAGGGFNVPFGRYKRPYFPAEEMRRFHEKAQRAEFVHEDFQHCMKSTRRGDVIYCDPPYAPLSPSANFTSYSAGGFALELQHTLADIARNRAGRGIPVLISNHNTPLTRAAYHDAKVSKFHVQRYISCNGAKRGKAGELLALFTAEQD